MLVTRFLALRALVLLVLTASPTSARWQIIAHRGVFHDKNDAYCTTENSYDALLRAPQFNGVSGVEIDVKVTKDGKLISFHDPVSNGLTIKDNDGGKMNVLSVALGHQKKPAAIHIADHDLRFFLGTPMKIYGRGGQFIRAESKPKLDSLETILRGYQKSNTRSNFFIILDIQTSYIADRAAKVVRSLGMQKQVYLKLWASAGISPEAPKYHGANTCYDYARIHGLSGMMIIPEINELQLKKGTNKIHAFATDLDVGTYLDCWASAQKDHAGNGAAIMPMVAAMYPNAHNDFAVQAANQVFNWAEKNGRKKLSVIVMPDFCSVTSGRGIRGRRAWRSAGGMSAFIQPRAQVDTRRKFCDDRADFCVVDVLGDYENYHVSPDYDEYMDGICPKA